MNLRIRNGKHCSRQIVKELSTKYEGFDDNLPEGFWSLLKRAWLGQHHHYTKKYMPLYVAEAAFKYNNRTNHTNEVFTNIMRGMLYV